MEEFASWVPAMAGGLVVTLALTVVVAVIIVPAGMAVALTQISPYRLVRTAAKAYADVFRAIPLLALLVFIYYGMGSFAGSVGLSAFWLAAIALVLNDTAYISEVYRGALLAVPQSQWEAASSLGLGWLSAVRWVVIPQTIRPAIPSTLAILIQVIKDTSLASLVSVAEVTLVAQSIVYATFRPVEVYLLLAVMYLVIIVPLTLFTGRLERWASNRAGV